MARIRSTKLQNLRQEKSWYSITNRSDGPALVHIYDEIGFIGVSAQQFTNDMNQIKGPVEVHLNTPGGEVFDGIAIYNCLKQRGNVTIVVDALAASIGSVIAQAGNPTIMARNSQLMIHDGFGMTVGNAADMREMADLLDKTSDNIASIYADKTGRPAGTWRDAMRTETWFSAQEAVDAGLADQVQGESVNNTFDLSIFRNAGKQMHGDHIRWDPDGDGDCDACPEGDTDHDHWAADGTQLKSVPGKKKNKAHKKLYDAKYKQADRDRMAKSGEAMDDGSYPIADEEDLHNAIRAAGRGNAGHDSIRQHIIKRAHALGHPEAIPDNWNADGSLKTGNSLGDFISSLKDAL